MDAARLLGPDSFIPTKSVAVDLSGSTDHQFDVAANGKPTQAPFARRIFVGTGGDLVVRQVGDSTDRTYKVSAGQYITGAFIKVEFTGTTASNMIAEQ